MINRKYSKGDLVRVISYSTDPLYDSSYDLTAKKFMVGKIFEIRGVISKDETDDWPYRLEYNDEDYGQYFREDELELFFTV